jgi:4-hydroxy-4-methyl-2-oxoglutarate aldolase
MKSPRLAQDIIDGYMSVSTSNVSDALDRLAIGGAPDGLLPLFPDCRKIVGAAATMRLVPNGDPAASAETTPVIGTLRTIMEAYPGDVLVIDFGGERDVNSFGGVAGATAQHYGLAGVVTDGVSRDIDEFKALGLPVYGKGRIQTSIRGRCAFAGHRIPVHLSGIPVRPGDLVMADENGTVVVPQERIGEVLDVATACKATEDGVIAAIRAGADPIEAHERVRYDAMLKPQQ